MTLERILAVCSVLLTLAMLLAWPEAQPLAEGVACVLEAPDAGASAGLEDGDGCTLDEEDAAVELVCVGDAQ